MNSHPTTDLDRRLRRLHSTLDTSSAFGPELRARLGSLRTVEDDATRAERRALAYRERLATETRLRRRLVSTLTLTLLLGTLAGITAWFIGAPIGRALLAAGASRDPLNPLSVASLVLLVGWLWIAVRGASRGSLRGLALG